MRRCSTQSSPRPSSTCTPTTPGIAEGDEVRIASRCGRVTCRAHLSWRDQRGAAFLPFHFHKAAAALLTIDELDSDGKIPEFKFCTIEIERWPGPELQTNPSRAE